MTKKILALLCLFAALWSCAPNGGSGGEPPAPVPPESSNPYGGEVFYEIFVRSFADSDGDGIGDLNGVTAKLDYLQQLGVKGIWLMPINPSPSYHGYDVTDYTAVRPDYGTLADFDRLVAAAKAKGIKIVLDFVVNHTSNQHPWFADPKYRSYYTVLPKDQVRTACESGAVAMVDDNKYVEGAWRTLNAAEKYYGAFDSSMPDLNYGRVPNLTGAYGEILAAAKFWLARGAAGLRLDAVKHIYQNERGVENVKFLAQFTADLRAAYPDVYLVGEVLSGMDDTAPFFGGLPSLFHFDAWWKLEGGLMDWGAKYYAKDMQEAIYKFRSAHPTFNAATKLSNHDEDRAMSKLGGNLHRAKIACMAVMTTPGQPYVYYGEEAGMRNLKSNGDEYVREPILWGDSYTTSWRANTAPTATVAAQLADAASLVNFYKKAIALRNATPALQHGSFEVVPWDPLPSSLMAWSRTLDRSRVWVYMNASDQKLTYSAAVPPTGNVIFELNSASYAPGRVELPAWGILVVEQTL